MPLNISIPRTLENINPKISVIGVGGAGCNAVNTMINSNVSNIDFIVANTDGQALSRSLTKKQIQLGKSLTLGLGAGANHIVGEEAALESLDEIISELGEINMLFIATGMGGGTGTGASPIIAKAARDKGILTIAVATKPFNFEGKKRMTRAEEGLKKLEEAVDTLIVIPNQNLFKITNEKTTLTEAFKLADDVLFQGISGITDLITSPGMINLDFSDISTVMKNMGKAMMGTAESSGENRSKDAAEAALNNPLLDNSSINGASSILLNIKGGPDMALLEVDQAASLIRSHVDDNANIIFGTSVDENLEGIIKVSVVATGINKNTDELINSSRINEYVEKNKFEEKKNIDENDFSSIGEKEEVQIDIEAKIADIQKEESSHSHFQDKSNYPNSANNQSSEKNEILEDKKKELNELIDNRKNFEKQNDEPKQTHFLKKLSSFFQPTDDIEEKIITKNRIDPSIYPVNEKATETNQENIMNKNETPLIKLEENTNLEEVHEKQIDLLDLNEQEKEKLDENVLEIPAFLRRQAN